MAKALDAFRTISEVATELDVQKHVLRFWENKFPQVRPMKRGGGRRYYRPDDLDLLRGIRYLLHREGYTIKGVQKLLREQGLEFVKAAWQRGGTDLAAPAIATKVVPGKPGRKPRKVRPDGVDFTGYRDSRRVPVSTSMHGPTGVAVRDCNESALPVLCSKP